MVTLRLEAQSRVDIREPGSPKYNMPKSNQKPQQLKRKPKSKAKKQRTQEEVFGPTHMYPSTTARPLNHAKGETELSKCAFKYALAIADPFNPQARDACIPVYPSPPSLKSTSLARFTVAVGVNGYGYAVFTPTLANDLPSAFYTTSSFVGAIAPLGINPLAANNTLTGGVQIATVPTVFNRTQLTPSNGSSAVSGRIVSYGIRIRYTGTTMKESGVYYCYTSPDHANVISQSVDLSTLGGFLESTVHNINRDACNLSIYGIDASETAYTTSETTNATTLMYPFCNNSTNFNGGFTYTSGIACGSPVGVIGFTGEAGNTFIVELIQHSEFTGPSAAGVATPTDADQRGFEIVQAAAAQLPSKKSQTSYFGQSPMKMLVDGIKEVASALKPVAISKLVQMASAAIL